MANETILIVDDDERNLLALSEVLKPIADVATAASGKDALRLLLREEFAVILLDARMPGMDGIQLAEQIRSVDSGRAMRLILVSSAAMRGCAWRGSSSTTGTCGRA